MKWTDLQQAVAESEGDVKVNAVAGSGKTTTLVEYARRRPKESRILYLAFNKTVKDEAKRRFDAQGIGNVQVETAHSLAYRFVMGQKGYRLKKEGGYKPREVVELLGGPANPGLLDLSLANHILKLTALFCQSGHRKLNEVEYLPTLREEKARAFAAFHEGRIRQGAMQLLTRMHQGELEVTHDFYLKKFHLAGPKFPFSHWLFDEAQDASGLMLDFFLNQGGTKVVVGDRHQQIYGWRHAVNSLEKVPFRELPLSDSFRFGPRVAKLAREVVGWKTHLGLDGEMNLTGRGGTDRVQTRAVLARGNTGLLVEAIDWLEKRGRRKERIYFEGSLSSYTFAEESGASLYDVLNLYLDKKSLIRDPMIASLGSMGALEEYVEGTMDHSLGLLVEVVKEYGEDVPKYLARLKELNLPPEDRDKADLIFSTVHKAKGLEYDEVKLAPDFLGEARLKKQMREAEPDEIPALIPRLNEEVNLLYVALTRTRKDLVLPPDLIPSLTPAVTETRKREKVSPEGRMPKGRPAQGASRATPKTAPTAPDLPKKIEKSAAHGAPWTEDDEAELRWMFQEGVPIREIAQSLGRSSFAIKMRAERMGLARLDDGL